MAKEYDFPVWNTENGVVVRRDQNDFLVVEAAEDSEYKIGYRYNFEYSELIPLNEEAKEIQRRYVLLRSKERELIPIIFQWAEEHGLAELEEQIRIGIRISSRVTTTELEPSDWKEIFSERNDWKPEELKALKKLRRSNNEVLIVSFEEALDDKRRTVPKKGQPDIFKMKTYFDGRKWPYYLWYDWAQSQSETDRSCKIQIIKRLVSNNPRKGRSGRRR